MELVEVFKFSEKIPGFSKRIELCLNFCLGFCITELVLSNYNKISPKKQFYINHASHLNKKCLTNNVLYKASIALHEENSKTKIYYALVKHIQAQICEP